jgi:phage/plasmid-associated DNA primase
LFAFTNAIFDLKLNKFVEPEPSFYITKTCSYSYNFFYSKDKIKELDELIDTIFPDKEVKNYYLSILATGLCGLQIENCFIATGTGGNGKSLINSLMMKTCGQYAYKLPSDVLLSAIKTGPNPEVANVHNVRFLLTQEPNNKKKICCSTLKEITGDKTINVRELYSSKCSINLKNTTLIEANEIPAVDEVNDAVSRRLRTIPFTSRYVEKSVYDSLEDKTNVFIADSYYKTDEFQNANKQALFELLIPRFKSFVDNKHSLPPQPKCCLDKCADFLGTCDDVYGWFELVYEKTDNIENSEAIPLKDIYSEFSTSSFFMNLSKSDKRKYNKKYFFSKIDENIFLRKYVRLRDSYHQTIKIKTDYIIGWKKINIYENTEN